RDVGEDMTFVLDEKASPKAIDFSQRGRIVLGIYAFDDGTLKVCIDLEGKDRPADFKTKQGSRQRSYVLKRQPQKAEPPPKPPVPKGVEAPQQTPARQSASARGADAEELLAAALKEASASNKRVLLVACTATCLPCRQLEEYFAEVKPILDKHTILFKLDLRDMKNADAVHRRFRRDIGKFPSFMPWMVVLDSSARPLAESGSLEKPDSVLGIPQGTDADRRYFVNMLRTACDRMTDGELDQLDKAAKGLHDRIWAKAKSHNAEAANPVTKRSDLKP
ncbi:MAG: hypothetical protein L0Y72_30020, partial [Gemmataceae bacterium]|nr:hypothetical protein [Gemmataceae bacterium]